MSSSAFYGPDLSDVHHSRFGEIAEHAAARLLLLLAEAGISQGNVVDLACGSGILARILSDAGYHVLGVDLSAEMVRRAAKHAPSATFRQAPLHDVQLPPAVAVTAIGEAVNYAADPRAGLGQLERLAQNVRACLTPRGVFLFDFATPGRAGPDGSSERIIEDAGWLVCSRAAESPDHATLDRYITLFRHIGDDRYRRTDEHHVLRLYEREAVAELLRRRGFMVEFLGNYLPGQIPSIGRLPGWVVVFARPAWGTPRRNSSVGSSGSTATVCS